MKMFDLKLSRVISRKCMCLSLLDMAELRVKRRYGSPLVPHCDSCLMWFAAGSPRRWWRIEKLEQLYVKSCELCLKDVCDTSMCVKDCVQ